MPEEERQNLEVSRWNHLDRRLNAVERDITELSAGLKNVINSNEALGEQIDKVADLVTNRGRTNWSVILAAGMVILALIGVYSQLVQTNMETTHEYLERRIDRMDANLQREMRDLDSVTSSRLDSLDTVLQREMRLLRDADRVAIESARRDLEEIRKRLEK